MPSNIHFFWYAILLSICIFTKEYTRNRTQLCMLFSIFVYITFIHFHMHCVFGELHCKLQKSANFKRELRFALHISSGSVNFVHICVYLVSVRIRIQLVPSLQDKAGRFPNLFITGLHLGEFWLCTWTKQTKPSIHLSNYLLLQPLQLQATSTSSEPFLL